MKNVFKGMVNILNFNPMKKVLFVVNIFLAYPTFPTSICNMKSSIKKELLLPFVFCLLPPAF